jgi:Syd protein (SUKH-2)
MKIKNILYEYFKWYDNMLEADLPKTPVIDDSDPLIYVGEVVNDWVRWRPTEKDEQYDFKDIEGQLNIEIHSSVKEYYNSYWFYQLIVDYENFEINMYPVIPGNYIKAFLSNFSGYINAHPGSTIRIPIGFEMSSTFLVVIENSTGKVQIEDYENETFEDIADNLYILLSGYQK